MYIRFAWNHTKHKLIEVGEEYMFIENIEAGRTAETYKAIVEEINNIPDKYQFILTVTKQSTLHKHPIGTKLIRNFPRIEENHAGLTQIYNI